jgi:hypothetical protein
MTKQTYFITAWCDRPFFAKCEVEALTPEEALAKAREAIHDADAEECDHAYNWDTWCIDTAKAEGVLLHQDPDALVRNSASELLKACNWLLGELREAWDDAEIPESVLNAIASAEGSAA